MSEERQITVYDEFNARHAVAYAGFQKWYSLQNPPPEPVKAVRDIVSFILIIALAVVMGAAILVSGSRTIDEFGGSVGGVTAFVMIEGGIMATAFFIARRTASKERLKSTVHWAIAGLVLTFIVGLGANVDDVLRKKGIVLPPEVNTFINLLVAVSAPTLAFITSDILAIELMATDIRQREADAEYKRLHTAWADGMNRSWAARQKQWGVKVEVMSEQTQTLDRQTQTGQLASGAFVLSASEQTDSGQPVRAGFGHTRTPDGQTQVIAYLTEHPEDAKLPSRELAKRIGVGHDTANKGRNVWRNQQVDSEVASS